MSLFENISANYTRVFQSTCAQPDVFVLGERHSSLEDQRINGECIAKIAKFFSVTLFAVGTEDGEGLERRYNFSPSLKGRISFPKWMHSQERSLFQATREAFDQKIKSIEGLSPGFFQDEEESWQESSLSYLRVDQIEEIKKNIEGMELLDRCLTECELNITKAMIAQIQKVGEAISTGTMNGKVVFIVQYNQEFGEYDTDALFNELRKCKALILIP
jgi:hypothetical protein